MRRRSAGVTVGLVAMVSMAMTGCSGAPDADYDGVCVDTSTQRRVDDGECDNGSGGHGSSGHGSSGHGGGAHVWRYYSRGTSVPAPGGTTTVPDGLVGSRGGVPAKGGTVSRG